jgi:FkbM family methyltransferase
MPQATGWVQRPFADRRALVLRTTYSTPQAFYECLHHADAVVGLNTSAELEAGIAGRPVFTLLSHEEGADGQTNTLHFNYLLREQGGFVACAADMPAHVDQLAQALASPPDTAGIRAFIDAFLRPCGGPVSPLLARMLIERAAAHVRLKPDTTAAPDVTASPGFRPQPDTTTPQTTAHLGALPDDDIGVPEEARKKVLLGYPGSTARVLTTPETRRNRRKGVLALDEATVAWLDAHVHPGDTLYDIGAGVGPYSLAAALHRGALCVAFEPGFASFKRLCDNLLLNACYRSVIPLPIALGEQTGLLELEYPGEAGGYGASLRAREWRTRRDAIEAQYTQPVCAERLDDVVERHRLPKPQAIRISLRRGTVAALRGAAGLLRANVRSIAVTVRTPEEADEVKAALRPYGFAAALSPGDAVVRTLVLSRSANQEGPGRAVELLRRVAGRMRG